METKFAHQARKKNFNHHQLELIIGSLLGDGHLAKTTRGFAFRVNHGIKQKNYVDWKYRIIKEFVNSTPCCYKNLYYFRTISHPAFKRLRERFYCGNKKILPNDQYLKKYLTPFVLAVWIMDDGSRDGRQIRLNTQSFSKKENEHLSSLLRANLGIETTINRDKNLFRLRVRNISMEKLISITKSFIIPSMFYKLSL